MDFGEIAAFPLKVAFHCQGLEGGLSSEEYEQWRHASITVFKPLFIS